MNATVSGSLKKGLISIAPLYVALMGVFFVPVAWGAEIDKPCQYDDTTNSIECGAGNKVTANLGSITAIGLTNTVSAIQAVAVGRENTASGGWSSAIGNKNIANENNAVAMGNSNNAQKANSVAVGVENVANNGTTTAVGFQNKANGLESSALGYGNTTNDHYEVAVGYKNTTNGARSTAVGNENQATALWSSAVGGGNTTSGTYSSAVGFKNNVSGGYASAFGAFNSATADYSIALGSSSNAYRSAGDVGYSPVGKTYDTDTTGVWKSNRGVVAVGDSKNENAAITRQITGVAAGKYDTDAVNVAQLKEVQSLVGTCSYDSDKGALQCGDSTASGDHSTAIGYKNTASILDATALGTNNAASGERSSAVGYYNTASGEGSFAVGSDNTASGDLSSAVGSINTASGIASSAVGSNNTVSGDFSSVLGSINTASGNTSSAVGSNNTASGNASSAVGNGNTASGNGSSAVGLNNYALSENSHAFGGENNYSGDGISSVTMGTGAVAVGYRNNYKQTGAVTVGQESTAVGVKNIASGIYSSAMGRSNTASGEDSSALGVWNTASGERSSAVGWGNTASGDDSSALGFFNTASGSWSSAVGSANIASGFWSSAMGFSNTASGYRSSAVGHGNTAKNMYSSAIGIKSRAEVDFGTAVGFGSLANRDQGTKGVYAPANLDSLDAKGKAAWQATSAALAVGNPDNTNLKYYDPNTKTTVSITTPITRQITGVAAGSQDTDAVNVAQLKEVAALASGGSFSPFTVSDGGSGSFTVGSAGNLKMVGSNANITTTASGDTVTFALADDLTLTSVTTGGVKLSANGLNNGGKQIKGVATGTDNTDAVNVKQLNDAVANAGKTTLGAVKGDNKNITTKATDKEVQVALNDDITLNSVTTGNVKLSAKGLNNGGNVISNVAAGSKDTDAVNVKQLKDANAANLKASVNAVKGDNKNITTKATDKEVQVALNNDISLNSVTAADKITVGSLTVNQNGKITGVVSDINDDSTAVNVGLLKEELKKGGNYRPITVAGDTGSFEVDNGGKAIWAGDSKNITTAANGDTVKIELNKNIKVDSVTAGSTVVNNDGVKVGNNGVALTPNGLNNGGQVISGVAAGVRHTDAVNVAQLHNAVGGAYARIDSVEKHANAGIAQAMATGAMMTSTQAGQGFLSLSGSTYRGEQGYAMGYSHMSDSGKWGVKFIGSGNSRGKFGGAASLGFRLY